MENEIKAGVKWWCETISGPIVHDAGDLKLNMFLALMKPQRLDISSESLAKFAEKLSQIIREKKPYCIGTDYHPDGILQDAADAGGIPYDAFPIKTMMWIKPSSVEVRHGYAAPIQALPIN